MKVRFQFLAGNLSELRNFNFIDVTFRIYYLSLFKDYGCGVNEQAIISLTELRSVNHASSASSMSTRLDQPARIYRVGITGNPQLYNTPLPSTLVSMFRKKQQLQEHGWWQFHKSRIFLGLRSLLERHRVTWSFLRDFRYCLFCRRYSVGASWFSWFLGW